MLRTSPSQARDISIGAPRGYRDFYNISNTTSITISDSIHYAYMRNDKEAVLKLRLEGKRSLTTQYLSLILTLL